MPGSRQVEMENKMLIDTEVSLGNCEGVMPGIRGYILYMWDIFLINRRLLVKVKQEKSAISRHFLFSN